jgi:hypothetical protein
MLTSNNEKFRVRIENTSKIHDIRFFIWGICVSGLFSAPLRSAGLQFLRDARENEFDSENDEKHPRSCRRRTIARTIPRRH